jgi:lipid A 3-O-deacylase
MSKVSLLFLGGLAFAPFFAHAEDDAPYEFRKSKDLSALEFTGENDGAGVFGGDRDYTFGWKAAYVTPSLSGDPAVWNYRAHFGVAQEVYTAREKNLVVPPADSHPYSAWLYAMAGLGWEDETSLDLLTLRAGVVGPSALGEQAQNNGHRALGYTPVKGWGSQLKDEPGIDIAWSRTWRARLSGTGEGFGADILPRIAYEIGTVRHFGSIGTQVRFGKNLPADFGVRQSRDAGVNGAPVAFKRDGGLSPDSYYGFIELQGEGRLWDMAVDGNMFHKGNGVPTNTFVGQAGFGVAAYWGATRIALTEYIRTEEFKGQDGLFGYASLSATVAF